MTFENVYLDFRTKMPKMPVFAQNATPLNYPEPSHMGGLPLTLAPPPNGGAKIKKDGGANGGGSLFKGKNKLFRAEGAPIFFLAPPLKFWAPPYGGAKVGGSPPI